MTERNEKLIKFYKDKLEAIGYKGLVDNEGCACSIDDLIACDVYNEIDGEEWINGCFAAYKHPDPSGKSNDFVLSTNKDSPTQEQFDNVFGEQ